MNKEVDDYIEKQKSPQKEICQELRKIILKTFPDIKEEMKLGVPFDTPAPLFKLSPTFT